MDFAKGQYQDVASAVETEVRRFIQGEPLLKEQRKFDSMSDVFGSPKVFGNVPLLYFILPTESDWTAIWTTTFLCSGYDSLCACLTRNHGFETVHFTSSDTGGPFQPGTVLSHRTKTGERHIAAIQEDTKWTFHASGTPLPEEDLTLYQRKKIKERWNSKLLLQLLQKIGILPWSESFYDLSHPTTCLDRTSAPLSIIRLSRDEFIIRNKEANQSVQRIA
jgi:hypothetical protein